MTSRIDYNQISPKGVRALLSIQPEIEASGLEPALLELVKMRASQINGCAFCLDMHSKDARAAGETEQRLYLLNAWREAPFYTPRERAALAWTEAVTRLTDQQVSDEVYAEVSAQFTPQELVALTFAVTAINTWNRLNVAFRTEAGGYKVGMFKQGRKTA